MMTMVFRFVAIRFWMVCCVLVFVSADQSNVAAQTDASTADRAEILPPDSAWYDAQRQSVVSVPMEDSRPKSSNRDTRWVREKAVKPPPPTPNASNNTAGGWSWPFGSQMTLGNILGWVFLVFLLGLVATLLVKTLAVYEPNQSAGKRVSDLLEDMPDQQTIQRMGELPEAVRRADVNLRQETMRLIDEGRFDLAIVTLFGHQLLLLDRAGCLRLARGKTNQRYVRETRSSDVDLAKTFSSTVSLFERVYFGSHTIEAATFEQVWQQNLKFEKRIVQRKESTAVEGEAA